MNSEVLSRIATMCSICRVLEPEAVAINRHFESQAPKRQKNQSDPLNSLDPARHACKPPPQSGLVSYYLAGSKPELGTSIQLASWFYFSTDEPDSGKASGRSMHHCLFDATTFQVREITRHLMELLESLSRDSAAQDFTFKKTPLMSGYLVRCADPFMASQRAHLRPTVNPTRRMAHRADHIRSGRHKHSICPQKLDPREMGG